LAEELMKAIFCLAFVVVFMISLACGAAESAGYHVYFSDASRPGLSVMDAGDHRSIVTIALPGEPHQIEVSESGRYVYAATSDRNKKHCIAVIDMVQQKVVRTIGTRSSARFAVADDAGKFYVLGADSATLEVIGGEDGAIVKSIPLPVPVKGVAIAPGGQAIYLAAPARHEILSLAVDTGVLSGRVVLPATPRCIAFSPDGSRVYVACEEPAQVLCIDASAGKIVNRIALSDPSLKPTRLLVAADGSRLFVSTVQGLVQAIDPAASRLMERTGANQRYTEMALSPDGKRLIVSDVKADAIRLLDVTSLQVVLPLPGSTGASCIGAGPRVGGGALRWEARDAELTLPKGGTSVRADFRFVNTSDRPVVMVGLSTSCRCTTANSSKPADVQGKFVFAPGEAASIDATINVGDHHGRISKTITVLLDDPREPRVQLAMAAIIPENGGEVAARAEPAAAVLNAAVEGQAKRTLTDIYFDLGKLDAELQKLQPDAQAYLNPTQRAAIAPAAKPLMNRMLGMYDEVVQAEPGNREQVEPARFRLLSLLSLMEDRDAQEKLAKDKSAAAQAAQLTIRWWKASPDAAAQTAVLGDMRALAKKNPGDPAVLFQIVTMMGEGPASREVKARAEDIVLTDLSGDSAKQVAERIQTDRRCRAMEGKPFVAEGKTTDGKPLSTVDWKGKVIAVHFWAPACKPCVKQIPEVARVYAAYHDKGFEIVGISCESKLPLLTNFLAEHKEMTWPELIRKGAPGDFHPLAIKLGMDLTGIPQMYLIDRKGNLRTVDGMENFEATVKKLLDETP
jgi:DNA-binding beta-propeller fold protein YncE/thiol-disulfide isomerase/thioredoxin